MEVIKTERLDIRRFTADDWKDLHEYLSEERVVRYEPYLPFTEEQSREAAADRAVSKDFWAVCLKENGKLIGNVYLAEGEQQNWEVGYVFNYAYQKKGYATEAVKALMDKIFRENNAHRIYANCDPENHDSWKLLEGVGFHREGHLRKNVFFHCAADGAPLWKDTFIYGYLKDDQ